MSPWHVILNKRKLHMARREMAMFKQVQDEVWAYDIEWVPDVDAGRVLYDLDDESLTDEEIMSVMWQQGGASEDNPTPFLKTVMCRIVSIAVVRRKSTSNGVSVDLMSLPKPDEEFSRATEREMLRRFLDALGSRCPQLVGFNSSDSDLKILIQRAVVHGISAEQFCARPDKPWEGVDYFARGSDWNIDLMRILGGWGKATPSLHEIAMLSGIPGKFGISGSDVASMWLRGEGRRIVDYNECDAITTYLVWLRLAHFGGKFNDSQYEAEQELVRSMLTRLSQDDERSHLREYLAEWERLTALVEGRSQHVVAGVSGAVL